MPQAALLIEDDPDIAELIRYNLSKEGISCALAADGRKGLSQAGRERFDLVLLDIMLPGMEGLEVLKALKRDTRTEAVPVMLVTAKGEETDIVLGLELGAEDYLVKPFSPRVLVARVKTLLRRTQKGPTEIPVAAGPIRVDPSRHEAAVAGKPLSLTLTEFNLLLCLAKQPGRVFTRSQLLDAARGTDVMVLDRTVDVHLSSLRRKLGKAGDAIETIRGVGYRLRD